MLAILVRVLMLVACGPLLVPPGFCVCKAGESNCTTTHRESAAVPDTDPTLPHTSDRCSHHHGPVQAAAPDLTPPGLPTPPAPTPHDDHAPGCPAATAGVERLRWVEPTVNTSLVPVLAAFVCVFLVPVTCECRPPDLLVLNGPCSPPLYLSHCSLVI